MNHCDNCGLKFSTEPLFVDVLENAIASDGSKHPFVTHYCFCSVQCNQEHVAKDKEEIDVRPTHIASDKGSV